MIVFDEQDMKDENSKMIKNKSFYFEKMFDEMVLMNHENIIKCKSKDLGKNLIKYPNQKEELM